MPRFVPFDDHADRLSTADVLPPPDRDLWNIRKVVQADPDLAGRYFAALPMEDEYLCVHYFIDGLSLGQISELGEIDKSVVSRRLRSSMSLLRVLSTRPKWNPLGVSEDLKALLPPELVEAAFFFYFEFSPNRVRYFFKVSESGIANARARVLKHLEELSALPEQNLRDSAALERLGLIDAGGNVLTNGEVAYRRQQASHYLKYLRRVQQISSRMSQSFRKDDAIRANALHEGASII